MNTTVIITLIICATIIAFVAIICNHCSEKKMTEANADCTLSKKIIRLHRNYIAGILGFAIIMLLTSKYGGPNNAIFEYLSFGATITSLVLSILAIFVTVQSSSDLYKQFTRIDNATDTINNASAKIDGTLSALQKVEANLTSSSSIISSQLEGFVEKIDEIIKNRMKETESNITETIAESLNNVVKPIDLIRPIETSIQDKGDQQTEYTHNFILISSANGLLALYACALSAEKQKVFEISDLFKGNEAYTLGFLIASISAGFVQFTHDATNNKITVQKTIFTKIDLYNEIKVRIKQQQLGSDYVDKVNYINSYFGIEPLKVIVE